MSNKFITKEQAGQLIKDGDTILTVGMTLISAAESVLKEIEKRFLQTGSPNNLTLIHSAGQCARQLGNQHFAHEGMTKRIIGSHWGLAPKWMDLIANDKVEAFCMPQGQMVHLYTSMAQGLPGRFSKIGLGTFVDPMYEGGKMNNKTKKLDSLIERIQIKGEDYLWYPSIPINVVIIRGTTADEDGNLTTNEEAMKLEVLPAVLAAKRFGGIVIAQCKYVCERHTLNPKDVVVPGNLIDYIVECDDPINDHRQTFSIAYDPSLCGLARKKMNKENISPLDIRKLIGKIGCLYLYEGCVINLGTGIPNDVVGLVVNENELSNKVTITVESGIWGGHQLGGIDFGIGRNLNAMISHGDQMTYYNGAGVDITFMGAGELDENGNVNATFLGKTCPGAGGFIDITQTAKHVIFLSTFTAKGLEIELTQGKLKIVNEGSVKKFVKKVRQVSYNGEIARKNKQKMHFVTERAVFELTEKGVELVLIAPGVDLQKDILDQMEFKPIISKNLKQIDSQIFSNQIFNYL